MRKMLTILLTFLTVSLFGQDIKPIDPNFKPLQSPSFSYYTLDSSVWIYKGAIYGWTRLASYRELSQNLGSTVNCFYGKVPVVSTITTVAYPSNFINSNYHLNINSYYNKSIYGKTVSIQNATYDLSKTVSGFSVKVDTIAGYIEYLAVDSTSLQPLTYLNYIPRTDIVTVIGAIGSDTKVPSEKAVRDAISAATGTGNQEVYGEVPYGTINGSNVSFHLTWTPVLNTERLYLNGLRLTPTVDYTISSNAITMNYAPWTNSLFKADYMTVSVLLDYFYNVIPSGTINGSNTVFLLPITPSSATIYLNGVRQTPTVDYTLSNNIIIFSIAPPTGSVLISDYKL